MQVLSTLSVSTYTVPFLNLFFIFTTARWFGLRRIKGISAVPMCKNALSESLINQISMAVFTQETDNPSSKSVKIDEKKDG